MAGVAFLFFQTRFANLELSRLIRICSLLVHNYHYYTITIINWFVIGTCKINWYSWLILVILFLYSRYQLSGCAQSFLFSSHISNMEAKSFIQHSVFSNKICQSHNKQNCSLQVFVSLNCIMRHIQQFFTAKYFSCQDFMFLQKNFLVQFLGCFIVFYFLFFSNLPYNALSVPIFPKSLVQKHC